MYTEKNIAQGKMMKKNEEEELEMNGGEMEDDDTPPTPTLTTTPPTPDPHHYHDHNNQSCYLVDRYWHLIGAHPIIVCVVVSGVSVFLSILGLAVHPPSLDANPEEAFRTWKTDVSGRINTWRLIQKELRHSPPPTPFPNKLARFKRNLPNESVDSTYSVKLQHLLQRSGTRENAECVLHKLNHIFGFALNPTENDHEIPIRIAVYEIQSQELAWAKLHAFEGNNDSSCLSYCQIFPNFPEYESISLCQLLDCGSELFLRFMLEPEVCTVYDGSIDSMLGMLSRSKTNNLQRVKRSESEQLYKTILLTFCTAQKIFLSSNSRPKIVERTEDAKASVRRRPLGTLPPTVFTSVYFRYGDSPNDSNLAFHDTLIKQSKDAKLDLVGIFQGERGTMDVFERTMWYDMRTLIPVTLLVVFIMMLSYTGSIFYSTVVLMTAGFSFTVSYYLYFLIFQTFWFTNYLGAVILLGIGADDCFVLVHSLHFENVDKEVKLGTSVSSNGNDGEKVDADHVSTETGRARNRRAPCCRLFKDSLSPWVLRALKHASVTMFITSATTAAAFLCNFITPVMGIKAFGIFSGTLVVVNYLLVVTLVPASLILKEKYLINLCGGTYAKFSRLIKGVVDSTDKLQVYCFSLGIPRFVNWAKIPLALLLPLSVVTSCVFIFYYPGLKKAQDTTQLFHYTSPIQWFQEQFLKEFDLQSPSQMENLHVVWGIQPTDTSDPLTSDAGQLAYWRHFEINYLFMENQEKLCKQMEEQKYLAPEPEGCFATTCVEWKNITKEEMNSPIDISKLKKCTSKNMANTKQPGRMMSGPYWTGGQSSYIQTFIKKFPGDTVTCSAVTGLKEQVNQEFNSAMAKLDNVSGFSDGWVVPSSPLAFRRLQSCDLQDTLQKSTVVAVSIPVAIALGVVLCTTVVSQLLKSRGRSTTVDFVRTVTTGFVASFTCIAIIACTVAMMALMQWKLNTVESVIIALCIGLSFDFTMHYAYAYVKQDLNRTNPKKTLESLFKVVGLPVLMSFLSTFTAGFVFIFSNAFPFYQVGLFMMIVTAWSWLGSTFLFTAVMITFDTVIIKIWAFQLEQEESAKRKLELKNEMLAAEEFKKLTINGDDAGDERSIPFGNPPGLFKNTDQGSSYEIDEETSNADAEDSEINELLRENGSITGNGTPYFEMALIKSELPPRVIPKIAGVARGNSQDTTGATIGSNITSSDTNLSLSQPRSGQSESVTQSHGSAGDLVTAASDLSNRGGKGGKGTNKEQSKKTKETKQVKKKSCDPKPNITCDDEKFELALDDNVVVLNNDDRKMVLKDL